MAKTSQKKAGKTERGVSPISGVAPPKKNQFGQPEGNPRHNGAWKKSDTLRFKLQQVAKMTYSELLDLTADPEAGEFEKNAARTILEMAGMDAEKRWRVLEGLTNQDSGFPKQQVEQKNIEIKPIIPKQKSNE